MGHFLKTGRKLFTVCDAKKKLEKSLWAYYFNGMFLKKASDSTKNLGKKTAIKKIKIIHLKLIVFYN